MSNVTDIVRKAILQGFVAHQITDGITGKVLNVRDAVCFVAQGQNFVVSAETFDRHFTDRKDISEVIDGRELH